VSDRDADGGANIAALRITTALADAGHTVTAIYERGGQYPAWTTRLVPSSLATHTMPFVKRAAVRLIPGTVRLASHQSRSLRHLERILGEIAPDVVNVHNLHISDWSPEMIRVAAGFAPVVCTLHDTWTFTGRCVYPGSCRKYIDGCDDACPTADEYPPLRPSKIAAAWSQRRAILADCPNVVAVSPSDWLAETAARGIWRERAVFKIPYAIDLRLFTPRDRSNARRSIGLAPDDRIVLASASDLANARKGVRHIIEALAEGIGRKVRLLLVGAPIQLEETRGAVVQQLGFIADDSRRAAIYSCADLFVHSAREDNAPLTVIESLACGTPVVAFPVDGIPETVIPGRTGWLADGVGTEPLRLALSRAVADLDSGVDLGATCRAFAESRYDPADIAAQYTALFERLRTANGLTRVASVTGRHDAALST
jgi:glycosyltransferase involved in cell wall biosynthesis